METITLKEIHEDIMGLKKELRFIKTLIGNEHLLADDVIKEIEESRKKPEKEFISHAEMRNEFA